MSNPIPVFEVPNPNEGLGCCIGGIILIIILAWVSNHLSPQASAVLAIIGIIVVIIVFIGAIVMFFKSLFDFEPGLLLLSGLVLSVYFIGAAVFIQSIRHGIPPDIILNDWVIKPFLQFIWNIIVGIWDWVFD